MNRRGFVGRALALLFAPRLLAELPPEAVAAPVAPAVSPSVVGGTSLVASGGFCAPFAPIYELPVIDAGTLLPRVES